MANNLKLITDYISSANCKKKSFQNFEQPAMNLALMQGTIDMASTPRSSKVANYSKIAARNKQT